MNNKHFLDFSKAPCLRIVSRRTRHYNGMYRQKQSSRDISYHFLVLWAQPWELYVWFFNSHNLKTMKRKPTTNGARINLQAALWNALVVINQQACARKVVLKARRVHRYRKLTPWLIGPGGLMPHLQKRFLRSMAGYTLWDKKMKYRHKRPFIKYVRVTKGGGVWKISTYS